LSTRDTVWCDTPAAAATSAMVGSVRACGMAVSLAVVQAFPNRAHRYQTVTSSALELATFAAM